MELSPTSTQSTQDRNEDAAMENLLNEIDEILKSAAYEEEDEELSDTNILSEEAEEPNTTEPLQENLQTITEMQQDTKASTVVPANSGYSDKNKATADNPLIFNQLLSTTLLNQQNEEHEIRNTTEIAHENAPTNSELQQDTDTSTLVPSNSGYSVENNVTVDNSHIYNQFLSHYSQRLEHFQPSEEQLRDSQPPTPPTPLDASTVVLVFRPESLTTMIKQLRQCQAIAVNLLYGDENLELITVMTISTKTHDFFLDVERLGCGIAPLTEIFLNANIVKVVHSREFVLDRLKNSMHILCVNVFDVKEACGVLGTSKPLFFDGLKQLYGCYKAPKHMRANGMYVWSVKSLERYRCFSHYLVFFYEECKCKLSAISTDLLKSVFDKCTDQCKQLIRSDAKPGCYNGYLSFLRAKHQCELELFERTFAWRENTAANTRMNRSKVLSGPELLAIICNPPKTRAELIMLAPEFSAYERKASHYFHKVLQAPKDRLKKSIAHCRGKVPVNLMFAGDRAQLLGPHRGFLARSPGTMSKPNYRRLSLKQIRDTAQNGTTVNSPQEHQSEPTPNAEVQREPNQNALSDSGMNAAENIAQNESHRSYDSVESSLLQASKPKRRRRRLQYNATNGSDSE